jgi:hypothetical protein
MNNKIPEDFTNVLECSSNNGVSANEKSDIFDDQNNPIDMLCCFFISFLAGLEMYGYESTTCVLKDLCDYPLHILFDTGKADHRKCLKTLMKSFCEFKVAIYFAIESQNGKWLCKKDPDVVYGEGHYIINIAQKPGHFEFIKSIEPLSKVVPKQVSKPYNVVLEEQSRELQKYRDLKLAQERRQLELQKEADFRFALEQQRLQDQLSSDFEMALRLSQE